MVTKIKQLLSFGLAVFLSANALAQKVDREKLGYLNYIQPPASTELLNSTFYLLSIELEDKDAYRRQLGEQEFKAGEFKQADSDNSIDFTVRITEGAFLYGPSKKNTSSEKYTVNKVEKTRAIYYYTGDVRYHYTLKVINNNGEEIFRDDLTGTKTASAARSESLSIAHDNYLKEKVKIKQEILLEQIQGLSQIFNDQYSFVGKTIHLWAIQIKEKKYEYPVFNEAFSNIQRSFDILKATSEPTKECDEKLNAAINSYLDFTKDVTPEDSKSKKSAEVTAAAYYNLGIAQFLLKDYGEASANFKMASSYDEKIVYDVKHLAEVSELLARRQEELNDNSDVLNYLKVD